MDKRVYLCLAHMSGREQDFIREAFDTNWVVPLGPNVNAFEEELGAFLGGGKRVVALSAGTAAIHLGLVLLGSARATRSSASRSPSVPRPIRPSTSGRRPSSWTANPGAGTWIPSCSRRPSVTGSPAAAASRRPSSPCTSTACRPISTPSAAWPNGMESRCWRMPPRPLARSSRGASAARSGHWVRCRSTATR